MKLNREALFLGIIIGTPFATLIVNVLEIASIEGAILSQMAIASFCLVWYIRSLDNKEVNQE